MAFDKELALFYGFFNLRISKKTIVLEKKTIEPKTFFLDFSFFSVFDDVLNLSHDLGGLFLFC